MKEEGLRHNEGKIRHDLLPRKAIDELAKVLTQGAIKYAPRNWEKGMAWSKCIASMKRHISKYEECIDFDEESGLLHMAHVMTNAAFIVEYYEIFPQGDDRQHKYLKLPKIGLDIDEVLCDFVGGMMGRFPEIKEPPKYWNDPVLNKCFEEIKDDPDFWISLKPKYDHLPFEPHCYITSRHINPEVTKEWLYQNGFPAAKLYCVGHNESKVDVAKESGIDIFVDDSFKNFCELNNAGIFCYLYTARHNEIYNVGHRRIKSLDDIV